MLERMSLPEHLASIEAKISTCRELRCALRDWGLGRDSMGVVHPMPHAGGSRSVVWDPLCMY